MEINHTLSDKSRRDWQLIKEVLNGNHRAFAELVNNYYEPLFHMLLKIVKNRDDAEDLTLEAFGKAYKNLSTYIPDFAFSTWLYKIAFNNAVDFLRNKKNSQKNISIDQSDFDSPASNLISSFADPEETIIRKEKEKILQNLIKRLPLDYRKPLILYYFEGMSYNEIAENMGLPVSTIKTRLFRAKELLSTIINNAKIDLKKL